MKRVEPAPATQETPVAPSEEETTAGEEPTAGASFIENILATVRSKGAMAAELNGLKTQLATFRTGATELATRLAAVTAERDALAAEKARIMQAFQESETQAKTASAAAVELIASLNVPSATLPPSMPPAENEVSALEKQYAAEEDPKKKFAIAQKIKQASKDQ